MTPSTIAAIVLGVLLGVALCALIRPLLTQAVRLLRNEKPLNENSQESVQLDEDKFVNEGTTQQAAAIGPGTGLNPDIYYHMRHVLPATWNFDKHIKLRFTCFTYTATVFHTICNQHRRSDADIAARLANLPPVPNRLPLNSLLQLLPDRYDALIAHLLGTLLLQAISIDECNLEYTILPRGMFTLLLELEDASIKETWFEQELYGMTRKILTYLEWTQCSFHAEPAPFVPKQGLQALYDRFTTTVDCFTDMKQFDEKENRAYQGELQRSCEDILQGGARLMFNGVDHRFDWTVQDLPDDPMPVIILPAIKAITDKTGKPLPEPELVFHGYRYTVKQRDVHLWPNLDAWKRANKSSVETPTELRPDHVNHLSDGKKDLPQKVAKSQITAQDLPDMEKGLPKRG